MTSIRDRSPKISFPRPLGRWVATAVRGLPRTTAKQLRVEYHAHFSDALERSRAMGKSEEESVEEVLLSLGDADDARRELQRVHVTISDLRFIDKLTDAYSARRRPWRIAGWASLALLLVPQWTRVIGPLTWTRAAPVLSGLAIWLVLAVWDERSGGSPRARLSCTAQAVPFTILYSALIYASFQRSILLAFFPLLCASFAFHSLRAWKILRKMQRLERLPGSDPAIRV